MNYSGGYTRSALRRHRGANPHHRPHGSFVWIWLDRARGIVTGRDMSRWVPHNGAREMARRVRQMEARANG